jgi:hypothetical protein
MCVQGEMLQLRQLRQVLLLPLLLVLLLSPGLAQASQLQAGELPHI